MMQDYDGAVVVDATGDRIGTVERSYVDDGGAARFVEVKIGSLLPKHRLIPLANAQAKKDGLVVPYAKSVIVASPDASSAGDTLEGEMLERVRAYYAGGRESGDVTTAPTAAPADEDAVSGAGRAGVSDTADADSGSAATRQRGGVRDLGEVIEVPIVEEELVKRPVVKEVLRIRKDRVAEQRTIEATLRKEDVEIAQDGDVVAGDDT
jgi:hypothetical protein